MRLRGRLVTVAAVSIAAMAAAIPAAARDRVLATGTLRQAAGRSVPGRIVAYAWPGQVTHAVLVPVAEARAGRDGRFRLLGGGQLLDRLAAHRNGWVDLLLEADANGVPGAAMVSHRIGEAPIHAATVAPFPSAQAPPRRDIVLDAPTAAPASVPPRGCRVGKPYIDRIAGYKRPTVIGELNNAYRDSVATFAYGAKADSDISVAFSANGKGWEVRRGVHVSNSASAEVGVHRRGPYAAQITSNFVYGKYRITSCGLRGRSVRYVVKPDAWSGGEDERQQAGTIGVCAHGEPFRGHSYFRRDSQRAQTWERATTVIGITLAATSGYSQWVRTRFDFGGSRRSRHVLCGAGGGSPNFSPRIFSGRSR